MANTALDDIRARVGRLVCGDEFVTGTAATSGSTTGALAFPFPPLIDPAQGTGAAGIYEDAWLLLTAAARTTTGRERRCSAWNAATGVLTFLPVVSGSVANTDTFEVWTGPFRPTFVEFAVNQALIRQRIWEEATFVGTADQLQYVLATVLTDTSILTAAQIVDLSIRNTVTSGQYDYTPIPPENYYVTRDRGVLTLNLQGRTYTSADTLRLRWWRSLSSVGALSVGTDNIGIVNDSEIIDWCAYETWHWLLSAPLASNLGRSDQQERRIQAAEVFETVQHYRRRFAPESAPSLFAQPARAWGR